MADNLDTSKVTEKIGNQTNTYNFRQRRIPLLVNMVCRYWNNPTMLNQLRWESV